MESKQKRMRFEINAEEPRMFGRELDMHDIRKGIRDLDGETLWILSILVTHGQILNPVRSTPAFVLDTIINFANDIVSSPPPMEGPREEVTLILHPEVLGHKWMWDNEFESRKPGPDWKWKLVYWRDLRKQFSDVCILFTLAQVALGRRCATEFSDALWARMLLEHAITSEGWSEEKGETDEG